MPPLVHCSDDYMMMPPHDGCLGICRNIGTALKQNLSLHLTVGYWEVCKNILHVFIRLSALSPSTSFIMEKLAMVIYDTKIVFVIY